VNPVDVLLFEQGWWQYAGLKERAIRERFGVEPVAYYQRLNAVLNDERSVAIDPLTVKRLLRLRDSSGQVRRSLS
jgi:hypothetical protein